MSQINNIIYNRRYFRVIKWIVIFFFPLQAIGPITRLFGSDSHQLSSQMYGELVGISFNLFLFAYMIKLCWLGGFKSKMTIEFINDEIIVKSNDTRSIRLGDINVSKSKWKNGIIKLYKISAPYNDPIVLIPDSIDDPALKELIIESITKSGLTSRCTGADHGVPCALF